MIIPRTYEKMLTLSVPWVTGATMKPGIRSRSRLQELSINDAIRRISRFQRGCGAHLGASSKVFAEHGYGRHVPLAAFPCLRCNDYHQIVCLEPALRNPG